MEFHHKWKRIIIGGKNFFMILVHWTIRKKASWRNLLNASDIKEIEEEKSSNKGSILAIQAKPRSFWEVIFHCKVHLVLIKLIMPRVFFFFYSVSKKSLLLFSSKNFPNAVFFYGDDVLVWSEVCLSWTRRLPHSTSFSGTIEHGLKMYCSSK